MVLAETDQAEAERPCACGCGTPITSKRNGVRFVRGHNHRRGVGRPTPLGEALFTVIRRRGITVAQAAGEVGVVSRSLSPLLWQRGRCVRPTTREGLARFLGYAFSGIDALLVAGGGGPRPGRYWVTVQCAHCGEPIKVRRCKARRSHRHYCNRKHYYAWLLGRKHWPAKPPSGRRSGRHLLKVERELQKPSDRAIAGRLGITETTVRSARTGRWKPRQVIRYGLETEGILPQRARPPLAELILRYCVQNKLTLPAFALASGLLYPTVEKIVAGKHGGRAKRGTLRKLSPLLGLSVRKLRDVGGARLGPPKPRLGRPVTFTPAQVAEVRHLRDEVGPKELGRPMPWPEIGRRMGWPLKYNRRGTACDCPKARRAYASVSP